MPSDGREATTNSRFGALETPPVAELPKTRRASTVDLEARSTVVRSSASQPFNTACPSGRAKCSGDRRSVAQTLLVSLTLSPEFQGAPTRAPFKSKHEATTLDGRSEYP